MELINSSNNKIDQIEGLIKVRYLKNPEDILPLIDLLKTNDYEIANLVVITLAAYRKVAVPPLIEALKNVEPSIRQKVAEVLGIIRDPLAVQPLLAALNDPDEAVRVSAIAALGKIVDPASFESLLGLILAKPRHIRLAAITALKFSPDTRIVETILASFTEGEFRIGEKDLRVYIRALSLFTDAESLQNILDALTKTKVPQYLVPTLIEVIGNQKNAKAIPALIKVAEGSDDPKISVAALYALGKLKANAAFEGIVRSLDDAQEEIKIAAIRVLGQLEFDDLRIIDLLTRIINTEITNIRCEAVRSISKLKNLTAVKILFKALEDPEPVVRGTVRKGLAENPLEEVDKLLVENLQSKNPLTRREVAYALSFRILLGKFANAKEDAALYAALLPTLTDPDYGFCQNQAQLAEFCKGS